MKNENLCAITAITGQVGGSVARTPLRRESTHPCRGEGTDKGATWAQRAVVRLRSRIRQQALPCVGSFR
jgi:hypothetical protein